MVKRVLFLILLFLSLSPMVFGQPNRVTATMHVSVTVINAPVITNSINDNVVEYSFSNNTELDDVIIADYPNDIVSLSKNERGFDLVYNTEYKDIQYIKDNYSITIEY